MIVEKVVEVPIELVKIVEKEVHVEVEKIVYRDRIVEKPIEVVKIVEVERLVEKPVVKTII